MGKQHREIEEMEEMPEFLPDVPDINPVTLSKLTEPDRLMHNAFLEVRREISVLRKENRWLATNLRISYNRSAKHDNIVESTRRSFMGIPIKVVTWALTTGGAITLALIIENWWKAKK